MLDLPLAAEHERLGARSGSAGEWRVPSDYGDSLGEQRAVRHSAGVIDWSAHGKVHATGPDRLAFLDGLLTNDLKTLKEGEGLYAATLDHKAHVHGDMIVYDAGDHYLLETDAESRDPILGYLNKLLVSDEVVLADVTSQFVLLGVFGPHSKELVSRTLLRDLPAAAYDHRVADLEGTPLRVSRSPYFGGIGYEIWVPRGPVAGRLWRSLLDAGARPFGASAAEALRIESGRPKFGVDMDEHTLALEARLEPAISMSKGCYVGQEIVSRAVYRGHANRLLVGLEVEGDAPPDPGTPIELNGSDVGKVTSAARSDWRGKILALGYVRRAAAEPGTEVSIGPSRARLATLPFYRE